MLKRIRYTFSRLWRRLTGNPFTGVKITHISDEDLSFDPDIDRILRESEMDGLLRGFMSFGTLEDYNKEFVVFFKAHRREFLLDYSQRDGHFRV